MSKKRKISSLWEEFDKRGIGRKARQKCTVKTFKTIFSISTTKTSLLCHLQELEYFIGDKQSRLTSSGSICSSLKMPREQLQWHLDDALYDWIVDSWLCFQTVHSEKFKKTISISNSALKVSFRTTIRLQIVTKC